MSTITTKFSIGDACYTFDASYGMIYRYVVKGININTDINNTDISYILIPSSVPNQPFIKGSSDTLEEQLLYTDIEVKDVANTFLIQKSVSIFSNAGL